MELNSDQVEFIRQDICRRGITIPDLADGIADHICCFMENDLETDFAKAYTRALDAFGENGLENIQKETILLLILIFYNNEHIKKQSTVDRQYRQ